MKKKNILIFLIIIAAVVLLFQFYLQGQGYIKIDTAGVKMKIEIVSGPEPVAVKAREYSPASLWLSTKEEENTWLLRGGGPWGKLSEIDVKDDETTVLKLGPPFLIKPDVSQRDSQVSIGLSIVGLAGEHYSAAVNKNGRILEAPTVRIVDKTGETLASGKFEYG
ncbi:MAG: hypothetical protein ACYS0I_11495 [Planctomycetota bacterium]|jgi:hypothetical protein